MSVRCRNILKCIKLCDLEVEEIILDHIASGESVLTEDETELGVGLLDIGEGTMDLAVYCEGAIQHSVAFPGSGLADHQGHRRNFAHTNSLRQENQTSFRQRGGQLG